MSSDVLSIRLEAPRSTWWRHQMESFSALFAFCAGNSPVIGEFPAQKASDADLWCFFFTCARINGWVNNGEVGDCPACRTYEIARRFWEVVICPIYMCLTVYEFSFIWFDLCLFFTIFNFILNYIRIVTFWIFSYYKIWIMLIIYYFIWNYWIFYFVACLEVFWSVMS